MKQTYLFSLIEPNSITTIKSFKEIIKKLDSLFDFYRIEFGAGTFDAQFDYDYNRLVKMLDEHDEIRSIKMIQEDENEIMLGRSSFFTFANNNDFFEFLLSTVEFKWALRHESQDYNIQNEGKVRRWNRYNIPLPKEIELYSDWRNEGEFLINMEGLPGHEHRQRGFDDNLWFGSSWQMYFSDIYYKYIPKELFDAFVDCEENIILENGLRKITLYKDPFDYNLPENRAKQWAFRRQLGIDSIAHEVADKPKKEPTNLPVEITKFNVEKGAIKVTRYLNRQFVLCPPSGAIYKEVKEYDDTGTIVVSAELYEIGP